MARSRTRMSLLVFACVLALLGALFTTTASASHDGNTDQACPSWTPEDGFADVPDSNVHETAVDCVVWYGLATGRSAASYAPAAGVRRDQMASFMARLLERAGFALASSPPDAFSDDAGNAHEWRINQLAAAGIVGGKAPGRYAPTAGVTRGQMATFLVRAAEVITEETLAAGTNAFADDNGDTHEANIDKAAAAGFVAGRADGTYGPSAGVRRDQMASFLARVVDYLVENGILDLNTVLLSLELDGPLAAEKDAEVVYDAVATGGDGPPYEWAVTVDGEEQLRTTYGAVLKLPVEFYVPDVFELCVTVTDGVGESVERCWQTGVARPAREALPDAEDLAAVGDFSVVSRSSADETDAAALVASGASASSAVATALEQIGWSSAAQVRFADGDGEDVTVLVAGFADSMTAAEAVYSTWMNEYAARVIDGRPEPTAYEPGVGVSSIGWCDDATCHALAAAGAAFVVVSHESGATVSILDSHDSGADFSTTQHVTERAAAAAGAAGYASLGRLPDSGPSRPAADVPTAPFDIRGWPREPQTAPCEQNLRWITPLSWEDEPGEPTSLVIDWDVQHETYGSATGRYEGFNSWFKSGDVRLSHDGSYDWVYNLSTEECDIGAFAAPPDSVHEDVYPILSYSWGYSVDTRIAVSGTWQNGDLVRKSDPKPERLRQRGTALDVTGTLQLTNVNTTMQTCRLQRTAGGPRAETICPPALQGGSAVHPLRLSYDATSFSGESFSLVAERPGFNAADRIYDGFTSCRDCFR